MPPATITSPVNSVVVETTEPARIDHGSELAPVSVSVPAPDFTICPLVPESPPMAPANVPSADCANSTVPALAMVPRIEPVLPTRVPAATCVPPVYVFAPVSVSVPAPDFISAPAPEIAPEAVSVVPADGAKPPVVADSATVRAVANEALVASVPPDSDSPPDDAPSAASDAIESVPAPMVVPPE